MIHCITKRFCRWYIVTGAFITIFLYFQLLSHGLLNFHNHGTGHTDEGIKKQHGVVIKGLDTIKYSTKTYHSHNNTGSHNERILGVHPQVMHLYSKKNAHFSCLNKPSTVLTMSQVNDDYCDCPDGSDEPATSACTQSKYCDVITRFYCTFQLPGQDLVWVTSSRVNDGVCDCCDGSDEWDNHLIDQVHKPYETQQRVHVYQTPCRDQCASLRQSVREHDVMAARGREIKEQYIRAARGKDNPNHVYGKDGEFRKLRDDCLEKVSGKFTYRVCLFKDITQQDKPHPTKTLIGRTVEWLTQEPGNHRLRMTGGDGSGCPGFIQRSSLIELNCGLEDKIVSVAENELCRYKFVMTSPAAC